jgi:hypothetical protein
VPPRRDASAADRGDDPRRLAVRPAGRRYLCNYDGMSERFEWLCPQAHAGSCPCAGDQLQSRSPTMPLALGLCGPAGVIAVTAVVPVARSRSQSSTFRLRVGPKPSNWTLPGPSWLLKSGTDFIQSRPVPPGSNAWVATEVTNPCLHPACMRCKSTLNIRSQSSWHASDGSRRAATLPPDRTRVAKPTGDNQGVRTSEGSAVAFMLGLLMSLRNGQILWIAGPHMITRRPRRSSPLAPPWVAGPACPS